MARQELPATGGCLDEDSLSAYLDGALGPNEAQQVREHLDGCRECQRLAAAFARTFFDDRTSGERARDADTEAVSRLQAQGRRALRPGSTLGRYVVRETIGAGGMGVVYLAHDPELSRRVALKVVAPTADDSTAQRRRLLREARAAAQLLHPNIVTVFDVGQTQEGTYLAMEFVEGHSLRAFVGDPAIPLERRIAWLTDVARALAGAHQHRLVHRDIKPENVMVRADGVVKVVDFGIARHADLSSVEAPAPLVSGTVTQPNAVIGTPVYMAPEQLRNEPVSARCDQFAWGVLAYEVITGERPWKGHGVALVSEILTGEPPPLRALGSDSVPTAVEAIVRRAMAKDPAARFASMQDVVTALESRKTVPPTQARRASSSLALRTTAAGLAVLAAGAIVFAVRARSQAPEARTVASDSAPAQTQVAPLPVLSALPTPPDEGRAEPTASVGRPTRPPSVPLPRSSAAPPSGASAVAGSSGSAAPPSSAARPNCNPPFTWQGGIKVPKPECPLD